MKKLPFTFSLKKFAVIYYGTKIHFRKIILCLILLCNFYSSHATIDCLEPRLPNIRGPISKCSIQYDVDHNIIPLEYYVSVVFTPTTYAWSGTGTLSSSISTLAPATISVKWDPSYTGVYSLTVTGTITGETDCSATIYLQDCDCTVDPAHIELIDVSDKYMTDPNELATLFSPYATVSTVSGNPVVTVTNTSPITIFIRGELELTQYALIFSNCDVYMDKGSVIYTPGSVNDLGFTLDNTNVHGICEYMWQGIRMGPEGRLTIINNSSVSDAEYAIQVNVKLHMQLINSRFFKNYVTLYAPRTLNQNRLEPHNCIIENNDFDGGLLLPPGHYLGQLPAPQNDRTFAAMELHQLELVFPNTLGIPFSFAYGTRNVFHDLNIGIYGDDSNISAHNCDFINIKALAEYTTITPFNGCAIAVDNTNSINSRYIEIGEYDSWPDIKDNLFKSVDRSILLIGNHDANIKRNTISGNSSIAIELRSSVGHIFWIHNNHISSTGSGIFCNVNPGSFIEIDVNVISTVLTTKINKYGIRVNDDAFGTCVTHVQDNSVISYSTLGIVGVNNIKCHYIHNGVIVCPSSIFPVNRPTRGLAINAGSQNILTCNVSSGLYSDPYLFSRDNRAFVLSQSGKNSLSCNTGTYSNIGYQFVGGNSPTDFYGNDIDYLNDGILLGDYNLTPGTMGHQSIVPTTSNSPGNKFNGQDGLGTFGHAATMTINCGFVEDIYDNSWVPLKPLTNFSSGGPAMNPHDMAPAEPFECRGLCDEGGGGEGGGEREFAEGIATNTNVPGSLEEELIKWQEEKMLYENLREDPALIDSSTILENYMDSTQFNNKGKFGDVALDSKFIFEDIANGVSQATIDASIDDIRDKNDNIIPVAVFEETQKTMNEISLNSIAKGRWEFTTNEINSITEIANYCPYTYGPAVYEARVLYNLIDPEADFDDYDICTPSTSLRKRKTELSGGISTQIYPNPANDRVTIYYNSDQFVNAELIIVNSLNQQVIKLKVTNSVDLIGINISSLANGIYTCHLINNNNDKMIGKLSVVH